MENAADALKMAGAVLIFVLALSIIIFSFGQVREAADTIINYKDRETSYINGDYYYKGNEKFSRNVGLETIIPSIYRAYIEEYIIVFEGIEPLYRLKNDSGEMKPQYTLGAETFLGNESHKAMFIRAILYRDFDKDVSDFLNVFSGKIDFIGCSSLYSQLIKDKNNITESLGEYYEDDNPNVPDVNKTKKRIITYKVET